jgi:hypothetical protein
MIKLGDILNELLCEKEDRCKRIADKRYDKPSAYKSGAIVRCRQGKIWKDLKEEIKAEEAYRDQDAIQTVIDGKRELGFITLKSSTMPEETFWNIVEKNKLKTLKVPSNPYKAYIYYIEGAESKASTLKDIAEKYDGFLAYNATEEDSIQIGRLLGYREEDIKAYIEHNKKLRGKNISEEEESLHKWFSRQGGEGRSRGWVDCNTCEKNPKTDRKKCKPCGRQKGEDRAKYPSCRPTPTQCTREGKGKTWGKTK